MTVSKCKKELREKRAGKTGENETRNVDASTQFCMVVKSQLSLTRQLRNGKRKGEREAETERYRKRERTATQASNSHSRDCQTTLPIVVAPHVPPLLPYHIPCLYSTTHIRYLLPGNFEKGTLRRHLCESSFWPSCCLPCCGAVSKFFAEIKCHRCKWQTVNDER